MENLLCENARCVFEQNRRCRLEDAQIGEYGQCVNFVETPIDQELLRQCKTKYLEQCRSELKWNREESGRVSEK